MAGERSVRIDFEATEDITGAVAKIDEALDHLKGSLTSVGGIAKAADSGMEQVEDSIDEVGDEATQAQVQLAGLLAALTGIDAALAKQAHGVDIPVDIEDPDDLNMETLRRKVTEKLRSMDPAEVPADIDRDRLVDTLDDAETEGWAEEQNHIPAKVDVDVDESALIKEVKKAEEAADSIDVPMEAEGEVTDDISRAVEKAEAAAGDIELRFTGPSSGQTFSAIGRVSKAVQELEEYARIELKFGGPSSGQTFSAGGRVAMAIQEIEKTAGDVDIDIDLNVGDDVLELATLISTMGALELQAFKTAASSRAAAGGIDEMGDEAAQSAAEMTALQSVMSLMSLNTTALSVNVGAFNIALANLATQIPMLIGLLGTLGTALGGVAGAAGLAGVGLGGIVAGGFVAELERVEQQFSSIESKAEAMEAIMQSLMDAFSEAFQPLIEAGGEANAFFRTINGLLRTVNAFAKGIADSMEIAGAELDRFIQTGKSLGIISDEMSSAEIDEEIMSLSEFIDELGRIWSENAADIIAATKVMSAFLLPIIADIAEYIISGFDDMILFVTKFTHELSAIGPALQGLIGFAVELIDLTSTILQGLLPVFVGILSIATEVATALNSLNTELVRNIAGFGLLALAVSKAYGAYMGLADAIHTVVKGTLLESMATVQSRIAMNVLRGETEALAGAKASLQVITWNLRQAILKNRAAMALQNTVIGTAISRIWTYVAGSRAAALVTGLYQSAVSLASSALAAYNARSYTAALATGLYQAAVNTASIFTAAYAGNLGYLQAAKLSLIGVTRTLRRAMMSEATWRKIQSVTVTGLLGRVWALVSAKMANAAASVRSAAATVGLAVSNFMLTAATQGLIPALWGAVAGAWGWVTGSSAASAATWALNASIGALYALTGGLLAILPALAAALIAIAGVGAVLVGVFANMDSVTSGLRSVFETLKQMLMDIVNVLIGVFIDVWNSLMDAWQGVMMVVDALRDSFSAVAEALGFASSEGSMLNAVWDVMMAALKALFVPVEWLFDILGKVAWIIGGALAGAIRVVAAAITFSINVWKALIGILAGAVDWMLKFIGVSGGLSDVIDAVTGGIGKMVEVVKSLPDMFKSAFDIILSTIEDTINKAIDLLNNKIDKLPTAAKATLGIEKMEQVDLTGPGDSGKIDRSDVISEDSEDAENEVAAKQASEFNYNEENINNVAQEINADPEEKESLRRVVKDAMEEANAMHRRHQGHGG